MIARASWRRRVLDYICEISSLGDDPPKRYASNWSKYDQLSSSGG